MLHWSEQQLNAVFKVLNNPKSKYSIQGCQSIKQEHHHLDKLLCSGIGRLTIRGGGALFVNLYAKAVTAIDYKRN